MAHMRAFFVVIDCRIAIRLLFLVPMQIINVLDNRRFIKSILVSILFLINEFCNSPHRSRHHTNPADEIDMQLTRMGWLCTRIVIEARSQDMLRSATTPAIALLCRKRFSVVSPDFASLGFSKPEVMTL